MKEEWKDVVGYEGRYWVSNAGRVLSLLNSARRKRKEPLLMTPALSGRGVSGRLRVCLSSETKAKSCCVHRLVLEAFAGARPDGLQAAHLDGDRFNNHISNLAWVTPKENMSHRNAHGRTARGERGGRSKLCNDDIKKIIKLLEVQEITNSGIAKRFGVDHKTIDQIADGKTWTHITGFKQACKKSSIVPCEPVVRR